MKKLNFRVRMDAWKDVKIIIKDERNLMVYTYIITS
jgi:hypothetical protein